MPAADRSSGLVRISGIPWASSFGRALRPSGVSTVSRRWKTIRKRGRMTSSPDCALDAEGEVAGVPPREPRRAAGGQIEGDLGARVARPHHENAPVPQLRRVAVGAGVELHHAGVQLPGERRDARALVAGHRHHHVLGLEPPLAGRHHEPLPSLREAVHLDARTHRQLEARRVGLQVVGHLVLGGEGVRRGGEGHPRQAVEAGRGEQAQRVPALAPGVPDARVGVQDHEGEAPPRQVVPDREARLAAPDDDRLDPLRLPLAEHPAPPSTAGLDDPAAHWGCYARGAGSASGEVTSSPTRRRG